MAECYVADNPNIALVAGTAKSTMVVTSAATQPFRIIEVCVSVDATATGLLKIEYLVATLTGGTTGTAPVWARWNGEATNKAPLATLSYYTAEPTYTKLANNGAVAIRTIVLPLPTGPYDIEYPLGREGYIPESTVFGVRLTSTTVSPNAYSALTIEE